MWRNRTWRTKPWRTNPWRNKAVATNNKRRTTTGRKSNRGEPLFRHGLFSPRVLFATFFVRHVFCSPRFLSPRVVRHVFPATFCFRHGCFSPGFCLPRCVWPPRCLFATGFCSPRGLASETRKFESKSRPGGPDFDPNFLRHVLTSRLIAAQGIYTMISILGFPLCSILRL